MPQKVDVSTYFICKALVECTHQIVDAMFFSSQRIRQPRVRAWGYGLDWGEWYAQTKDEWEARP